MSITHVGLVSIHCRDLERAIGFYTTTLGFTKTTDAPMGPGSRWVEVTPPGGNTRLTLLHGADNPGWQPEKIGEGMSTTFEVTDFEATCKGLTAQGVKFRAPPKKEFWGWWAEIVDSEGNALGLHGDA
jgi:lactoylglutathione lyase